MIFSCSPPGPGMLQVELDHHHLWQQLESLQLPEGVARGAAVGVEGGGGEERREHTALWGSTVAPQLRNKLAQPHMLLPVWQEVSDPAAGVLRHTRLR